MANAREQYLQAMASFTEMTRARAEQLAGRLAKQGDLQSGQVGRFAEDLVRRTQRNRETMSRLIQREVKRQLSLLGIATRDEVARLQQRVRALEQAAERQAAASGSATAASGATTGTRKPAASRSGAAGTGTGARKPAASRSGATGTGAAKSASTTARKPASGASASTGTTGGRRARGSSQTGQDRTEGE